MLLLGRKRARIARQQKQDVIAGLLAVPDVLNAVCDAHILKTTPRRRRLDKATLRTV